jgi:cation:H+ antiporter
VTANLLLLLWVALVAGGIGAMQWGAARASAALEAWRGRLGLRGVVAGALLGIATAAPEVSVNLASVGFGWPDLGLGAALGSNVPALPLVIAVAWLSRRAARAGAPPAVAPATVPVQALPYLLVVLLLAALTLPPAWAGLQPGDAALLLGARGHYLAHALLRRRRAGPDPEPPAPAAAPSPAGLGRTVLLAVPAIGLGGLLSVVAARRLGAAFGASDLVTGLFAIGLLCALPESFAARRLAREGRATTAVATAMGDGVVSLTLALVPPALVGAAVGEVGIYLANLGFLALALLAWMALSSPRRPQEIGAGRVAVFAGGYLLYLLLVARLLAR